MIGLLFWIGVIGLFLDWRYTKAGGNKPSPDDLRLLAYAIAISVISVAALAYMGANSGGLGDMTAVLAALVLFLWSARRFTVRRRHPVRNHGNG